jgi:hypothetical protein
MDESVSVEHTWNDTYGRKTKYWERITYGRKTKYWERILSHFHSVHHKSLVN